MQVNHLVVIIFRRMFLLMVPNAMVASVVVILVMILKVSGTVVGCHVNGLSNNSKS